jgi:hypothetical protein
LARRRLRAALVALDEEFERMRGKLDGRWKSPGLGPVQQVTHLSEQQLADFAQIWVRMVLETDDHLRQQGLDDDEFEEPGQRISGQREEPGQLLARGQSQRLVPAVLNDFKLCGIEAVRPAVASVIAGWRGVAAAVLGTFVERPPRHSASGRRSTP